MSWALAAAALPAIAGYFGQKETNEANVGLGREQMAFQERMSSTSYQRAVTDMQAAGLNPMLAYSQGGASSPPGSMPQVQNAVGAGISSAQQGMQMAQQMAAIKQTEAQTDLTKAQANKTRMETVDQSLVDDWWTKRNSYLDWSSGLQAKRGITEEEQPRRIRAQREYQETLNRLGVIREGVDRESASAAIVQRRAESDLKRLDVGRAEAENKFFTGDIGDKAPLIRLFFELMRAYSSARGATR